VNLIIGKEGVKFCPTNQGWGLERKELEDWGREVRVNRATSGLKTIDQKKRRKWRTVPSKESGEGTPTKEEDLE